MTEAGTPVVPAFVMPADVPDKAQLWLLRHGETEWSRAGKHTGRTDVGLLPEGERAARALAPVFASLHPALVLVSPRLRARQTAHLAGLVPDAVEPDLAEWDYGDYEGRTSAEISAERPSWLLWRDGAPNGETPEQVAARADRVLARASAALATGPVVLVAHGHISRMIAARWIGLAPAGGAHLLLSPAAPSILSVQYGVPAIQRWNATIDSDR
jgi:probable phosphoglycerate mutase